MALERTIKCQVMIFIKSRKSYWPSARIISKTTLNNIQKPIWRLWTISEPTFHNPEMNLFNLLVILRSHFVKNSLWTYRLFEIDSDKIIRSAELEFFMAAKWIALYPSKIFIIFWDAIFRNEPWLIIPGSTRFWISVDSISSRWPIME